MYGYLILEIIKKYKSGQYVRFGRVTQKIFRENGFKRKKKKRVLTKRGKEGERGLKAV